MGIASTNVRYWHKADIRTRSMSVRFWHGALDGFTSAAMPTFLIR